LERIWKEEIVFYLSFYAEIGLEELRKITKEANENYLSVLVEIRIWYLLNTSVYLHRLSVLFGEPSYEFIIRFEIYEAMALLMREHKHETC
jgi:hypothetical protein